MFEQLTPAILDCFRELEEIDRRDRTDGTPHGRRLRQVSPDTGRFLALLVASAPAGELLEIGTSAGYSTVWLALAARAAGRRVTTFEIDAAKATLARKTFARCGVSDLIDLVEGDALTHLAKYESVAFCFLDAEKNLYQRAYDILVPRMVAGGLMVADNAISHESALRPMLDFALADARMDSVLVPIGSGDLLCRKK